MFAGNRGIAAASGAGDVEKEIKLAKMREIDSQSGNPHEGVQQDPRLTRALRGLAASSRQGAPTELGAGLAAAFRRHHARRRLVRCVSIGAIGAGLALVGLMSLGSRAPHQVPAKVIVHEQPSSVPAKVPEAVAVAKSVPIPARLAKRHLKPKAGNSNITAASGRQFLALPGYDPAVPADELRVVRVQVPASALWQMGAPVSPDSGARRFMADFVVSQDGTPYAVRLVQ
jgi:hypothetical protein